MPWRPKDFTLVKHDGVYHLFYIRYNLGLPAYQTEKDLGHAVSRDLWHWSQQPAVIPARDSSWDRSHIWAPCVVEQDGVFHLFYTGVTDVPGLYNTYQRIGVATSTDLFEWNRMDAPVYACTDVPWTVCDSTQAISAFRDPFVMPDPAQPGRWLLYYSTYPAADSAGMVVGMASSDGDLTHWSDLGPLWITNRAYTYNDIVESPHLFQHAGLWYLLFTTNAGQPISFCTGPDPVGPPETWTYRGRLGSMLGTDTRAWIASEHLADGLVDYFAYVIADRIDVKRMVWGPDWQFSLLQPDFMHVVGMDWDAAAVQNGGAATLAIVAVNWNGGSVSLEGLRVRSDGSQVPVPLDLLGLPTTVPLTADTTRVRWTARWLPDDADTGRVLRLVVRVTDQTATATALAVDPPLAPDGPPDPDENPMDILLRHGIRIRTVRPLGGQPAVLVELDQAAPARLDVYDPQGRRVRSLADRELPAGATVLLWDGRNADGALVAPGVYFARLTTPCGSRTVRLLQLR